VAGAKVKSKGKFARRIFVDGRKLNSTWKRQEDFWLLVLPTKSM
jgi:hypothetical protein